MHRWILLLALCFSFLFVSVVEAGVIRKVKGKTVLILIEDMPVEKGKFYYAVDARGKKKAIIKIRKVRGSKAIGKVRKGKARKGYTLTPRKRKRKRTRPGNQFDEAAAAMEERSGDSSTKSLYAGALLGVSMDRMDVDVNGEIAAMNGMGINLLAIAGYRYSGWIGFRAGAGLEMFRAKGSIVNPNCNGSVDCQTNINYLTMDLALQIIFLQGSFEAWVGPGVGILFPMSKDTTALDPSSIVATSVLMIAAGFDINFGNMFIPLQLDYAIFPSSDQVTASWTAFRGGVGFRF